MKAVISNRIYMDCDAFMEQKLDEELTYEIISENNTKVASYALEPSY